MVGLVGASEMAHHQRQRQRRPEIAPPSRPDRPLRPKDRGDSCRCRYARRREAFSPEVAQNDAHSLISSALFSTGRRPCGAVELGRARHQSGEDIDGRLGKSVRKRLASSRVATKKVLQPALPQRGRSFSHAEPVGVGLDHGGAFGGGGEIAQAAIIGGERIEIDGENGGLARPFVARARGTSCERSKLTRGAPAGAPPSRDCRIS